VKLTLLDRFAVMLGSLALRLTYGWPVASVDRPKQQKRPAQIDGKNVDVVGTLS